jgi:hypothetical protein
MFGDDSTSFKDVRAHQQKARMLKFLKKYIPDFEAQSIQITETTQDVKEHQAETTSVDDGTQDEQETAKQLKKQKQKNGKQRLLVMELGCGNSLHSLRCDVELLAREHGNVDVIRINPGDASVRPPKDIFPEADHVGLKAGALEALLRLGALLNLKKAGDRPIRVSTKSRLVAAAHDDFLV